MAAVLHQQRHREPGVVRRRVRDEQRVIAVSLLHALLVVLLALLHGDHLRGAGLGGDGVARARAGARGGPARTRHVDHRGADERQVLGLEHRAFVERALQLADLLGPRILHRLQEPRMYRHAVVGEHGGGNGELQRGGEKISLADSHAHRVAGEPLLLEALPFPVGRRRESVQLAVDVDAGARAEVELDEVAVDRLDAELGGEPVVVRVARDHDRLVHVDHAMAILLPVAIAVGHAGNCEVARVVDGELGAAFLEVESRERHERLDGRAGRILAAQRAVVERLVGRIVERVPVLRVDAVDEEVGIESGL